MMKDWLIEIIQDQPGLNPFFGAWLCQDVRCVLVDVGPARTADRLIHSMSRLAPERVDYILITHIHLDHCGALAPLLEAYPMAKAVCHAAAIPHLVNPERLWAGSLKVLGDLARIFGPPEPVPRERLIPHSEADISGLRIIETPGHALHHLSYGMGGRIYAGEAAGNYLSTAGIDYMRPATPPRFFLDVFLRSIELLADLEDQPIRYAHFGAAQSSHEMLRRFRDQIGAWQDIISNALRSGGDEETVVQRSIDLLIEKDPHLAGFHHMSADVQARERMYMANSVRGFVEFLCGEGDSRA